MSIHEIINYKGLQEYYYTPELVNVNGFIQSVKRYKHQAPVWLMLYGLFLRGERQHRQMLSSHRYYCHDCSSDHGKPVYHYSNDGFTEFRHKWQRYAKTLNKIATNKI